MTTVVAIPSKTVPRTLASIVASPPPVAAAPKPAAPIAGPEHRLSNYWKFYFHRTDDSKWNRSSFVDIAKVASVEQYWSIQKELGHDITESAYIFLMAGEVPPLWESHENVKGGSYSMRIPRRVAAEVWERYAAAMLAEDLVPAPDRIVGMSIAPKKAHCIIKLWNLQVKDRNETHVKRLHEAVSADGIHYTPHVERRM